MKHTAWLTDATIYKKSVWPAFLRIPRPTILPRGDMSVCTMSTYPASSGSNRKLESLTWVKRGPAESSPEKGI